MSGEPSAKSEQTSASSTVSGCKLTAPCTLCPLQVLGQKLAVLGLVLGVMQPSWQSEQTTASSTVSGCASFYARCV